MAKKNSKLEKIKKFFLLLFVGIGVVLIMIILNISFRNSLTLNQGQNTDVYLVNIEPTKTPKPILQPTVDLNASPTPTFADWQIQE